MQATGILLERTPPRYWHRKEKSVETLVIESLANIAAGGENDPLVVEFDIFKFCCRFFSLF